MAVKLIANYAKRLGLPGYSSHQFSISLETERVDLGNVQGEASRIYGLLQDAVDREIQHVGFVPTDGYGMEANHNGNGSHANRVARFPQTNGSDDRWTCSDKQKELILKLVDEHGLNKNAMDRLAQKRFGTEVKLLNKLQASGLITEILETCGGSNGHSSPNGKGGGR